MNSILCFLSVVAVALAAPQHQAVFGMSGDLSSGMASAKMNPLGGAASWDARMGRAMGDIDAATGMTKFTKITTETTGPSSWTATGLHGEPKMMAAGRSLWNSDAKVMAAADSPAWNADAKMMAAGRSLWNSDAKLAVADSPAWTSDAKMMATGRSLWNSDAKLAVADSSAWNADAKMKAAGRSLWNSDAKIVAAAGRSAWDSSLIHKDAQPAVEILQQEYEMPAPGNYMFSYKTANGIEAQERAALKAEDAEAVEGVYSWVAPSGEKFAVEYVADETGYHARGAHIPEMPRAIARSLEWNAAHPEEEDERASSWEAQSGRSSAWKSGASGRSAWESAQPSWKAASIHGAAHGAAAGRSAWVSESSAALPAWESSAKIESASGRSWDSAATNVGALGLGAASGRSSWESHSALPAWESNAKLANLGGAKITKITETSSLGGSPVAFGSGSGLLASGRSASWTSDNAGLTGFSGFSGLGGATKITKITETKTLGSPSTLSAGSSFSASHL